MRLFNGLRRLSTTQVFSTKGQWKGKKTIEARDWVQSSMKGWLGMTPDMLEYFRTINDLYHEGAPINSLVAFGGTWFQLPAMYDNNPFDVWRAVVAATPAKAGRQALPLELLQRSSHQFGLEEVNQEVIRETYRQLAKIAGQNRQIIIRLFHFNNRDMHKDSTYAAIKQLRDQGIQNFVISDEHSYAIFMKNEDIAKGIVTGLLRNLRMTAGDTDYPIQGGIKDFSGSLAPQDAEEILRHTDKKIKQEVKKLAIAGHSVDARRMDEATITLHSHLTDRSQDTVSVFERVAKEMNRSVTTHCIHDVENATHHVMSAEELTDSQLVYHRKAEQILAKIVRHHKKLVVNDYEAGKARPWTGFAGGGTPMIQQFVSGISSLYKLQAKEAEALFYRHMEAVRDDNQIPTVTPAQKGVADLALLRIANEKIGHPLYQGEFTSESIDIVRNLYPELVKDKDMLEGAYRQYQEKVLSHYVKENTISLTLKKAIQKVGMNSDRTSIDKDKVLEVILTHTTPDKRLDPIVQDEIIEACGAATRPTRFPDQMAHAREVVAQLKTRDALKIQETEAVLIIATLRGRDIGKTLVEHHGNKAQFPALGVQEQKPVFSINLEQLWQSNVAGDVLDEVLDTHTLNNR